MPNSSMPWTPGKAKWAAAQVGGPGTAAAGQRQGGWLHSWANSILVASDSQLGYGLWSPPPAAAPAACAAARHPTGHPAGAHRHWRSWWGLVWRCRLRALPQHHHTATQPSAGQHPWQQLPMAVGLGRAGVQAGVGLREGGRARCCWPPAVGWHVESSAAHVEGSWPPEAGQGCLQWAAPPCCPAHHPLGMQPCTQVHCPVAPFSFAAAQPPFNHAGCCLNTLPSPPPLLPPHLLAPPPPPPHTHTHTHTQAQPRDPENFPFVVLGNKIDEDGGKSRVVSRRGGRGAGCLLQGGDVCGVMCCGWA
jgi:hypothetical protein